MFRVAVGADEPTHIFHDPQYRNIDLTAEIQALPAVCKGDFLRGGDHHCLLIAGDHLTRGKHFVAGPRGKVQHEIIQIIAPVDFFKKLFQHADLGRSAPDHGGVAVIHQQTEGDQLHAGGSFGGIDPFFVPVQTVIFQPEKGGLAGTVKIHVQQRHFVTGFRQRDRQTGSHGAFAHAAFPGKDQQFVFDLIQTGGRHFTLPLRTFCVTRFAVVSTFAHGFISFFHSVVDFYVHSF